MKWKKSWYGMLLVLGLVFFGTVPQRVSAENESEKTDFEVQPVLPDAQTNTQLNYFDLVYPKYSTHTIQMRVQNFSDKNITVESDLRNAYTQDGGGIEFTPRTNDLDPSLKHPFTTVARLDRGSATIKLAPKQMKVISATITMPKTNYDGMIYGDWHFIERVDKDKSGSTAIGSNYAYSVGVVLRGQNYEVFPDVKYDETKPILFQKHPALGVTLRNVEPMAISQAKVNVSVGADQGEVRTFQASNVMIAPNSKVVFPVSWSYDEMKPGTYHIKATIKGLSTYNRFPVNWTFKKTMKVTTSQVKTINERAIKKPVNHWLYAAIGSGVLLLASSGALLWVLKLRPK
ncbi:cell surface protein [Lacticaseibacillus chiayiensis]|uniref:Cell surface protein n=2 Tax=Lacticaseibacillus chiayiensis TaxID=2100821 RepID=A0A4Q1U3Y9_9LACO|nr:DUF916 and DUF3324 domain-containing protein [Lacticaseibacillus chiayiensis]RXT25568.1 cell surface protein [Lacticaseibacillus chiayiensis]RXT55727.1 cell surface protein [Lacticaseibacillus chiayiensis]